MMETSNVHCAVEFITNRVYLAVMDTSTRLKKAPRDSNNTHYFCIDDELVYENFYSDFGPLNIGMLYRYCMKMDRKYKMLCLQKDKPIKIVHYTVRNAAKFTNAALLISAYVMLYHKKEPYEALRPLLESDMKALLQRYRDASYGETNYTISLLDCLRALDKAKRLNFFNFEDFDLAEYQHYEQVPNGDLNWVLPGKFLAFCGPHSEYKIKNGYTLHSPDTYINYFHKNNVTDVVRLNKKAYDGSKFTNAGINHHDMVFLDGSYPSDYIMNKFLKLSENASGAIAVHCKAGLGRTGSLIGCYIMKHYRLSASETIAWLRLCRPGSVIGCQQHWLDSKEAALWMAGDLHRKNHTTANLNEKCRFGINSIKRREEMNNIKNSPTKNVNNNKNSKKILSTESSRDSDYKDSTVQKVMSGVNTLKIEDSADKGFFRMKRYVTRSNKLIEDAVNQNTKSETELIDGMSQGDRLSQIKGNRHARSATTGRVHNEDKLNSRLKSLKSGMSTDDSSIMPRCIRSRETTLSPLKSKKVSALANAQKETWRDTSRRVLRSANVNSQKRHAWLLGSMYRNPSLTRSQSHTINNNTPKNTALDNTSSITHSSPTKIPVLDNTHLHKNTIPSTQAPPTSTTKADDANGNLVDDRQESTAVPKVQSLHWSDDYRYSPPPKTRKLTDRKSRPQSLRRKSPNSLLTPLLPKTPPPTPTRGLRDPVMTVALRPLAKRIKSCPSLQEKMSPPQRSTRTLPKSIPEGTRSRLPRLRQWK